MILDNVKHKLTRIGTPSTEKPIFYAISIGAHHRIADATNLLFNSLQFHWKGDYFWIVGDSSVPPKFENGYVLEINFQDLMSLSNYSDKLLFSLKTLAPYFVAPRNLVYADLDCIVLKDFNHRLNQEKITITRELVTDGPINGGFFICPNKRWKDLSFWHEQHCQNINKTDQRVLKWLVGRGDVEINIVDDMVYYPWCMRDILKVPMMGEGGINHDWKKFEILHFNTKTWRWRLRAMNWYWKEWLKEHPLYTASE